MSYFYRFIEIDTLSATPKYLQIANSIIKAVTNGKLQDSDVLPSINEFSNELEVSRDTVEKGYSHLKKIGILASVAGKGYFIKNSDSLQFHKIFLLFNKLSTNKIIFPSYTYHPNEILAGFAKFCSEYAFDHSIIHDISEETIEDGIVYIRLMENDLVTLIEKIIDCKKEVGKDVGVISYNETPLKKIILNGITTISTDFIMMGKNAAQLILNKEQAQIAVPFYLTLRNSL